MEVTDFNILPEYNEDIQNFEISSRIVV